MHGTLFVIATPLGNLSDISERALEYLKTVDIILAEDTRRTKTLLSHFGIQARLISFFEYSKTQKTQKVIQGLKEGLNYALVSDAGTPCISDPGARLVAAVREESLLAIPVPGPSALIAALSVAGLPTEPFHFWGFLSPKASKRKKVYQLISELSGSHAFYVSPHKIKKLLEEWADFFSPYTFLIAREMTKKFESYYWGTYAEILEQSLEEEARGEYTVILSLERLKK